MTTLQERETYPATGFYWHLHHDILLEWCLNYQERVDFIQKTKPTAEVETRLRLFRPVRGILPTEVNKAWPELDKANTKWNKATAAWGKANTKWDKATAELDKTQAAWDKANVNHADEIKVLHSAECPDCPWDGRTIFPGSKSG